MQYTFKRAERLKSRKVIGQLFKTGKSFGQYPLRLIWVERASTQPDDEFPIQFAVSVPKKKFPKATQRNHIKRKIREAYRLQKPRLYQKLAGHESRYAWMVLYVAKEKMPYAEIEKSMQRVVGRFVKMANKSET